MTLQRSWAVAGAAVLLVAVVLATVVAGGQVIQGTDEFVTTCETAHPQAGGKVYCYVVRESGHRLAIWENDKQVATFEFKTRRQSHHPPFAMRSGVADPVAGGHVYCYLIHPIGTVYVFQNAEYVGKDTLSRVGQEI